ncbi:MAG: anti-sigma factor family protein [bacterium]
MNCIDCKSRMQLYLDQALPREESKQMLEHLKACPDCNNEYQTLQRVDALGRLEVFPGPPSEYWDTLPQQITRQLPRRELIKVSRKTIPLRPKFLFSGRLRAGLAVALGIVALVLLMRRSHWLDQDGPEVPGNPGVTVKSTTQQVPPINSLRKRESSDKTRHTTTRVAERPDGFRSHKNMDATANPPDSHPQQPKSSRGMSEGVAQKQPEPVQDVSQELQEPATVNALAGLKEVRKAKPSPLTTIESPKKLTQLYPIPRDELALSVSKMVKETASNSRRHVPNQFALNVGREVPSDQTSQDHKQLGETDSRQDDFAETLWLVQESTTLEEKRNIWLSYIAREQAPTYRSLGVYHLARVLTQRVEQSKNKEKALQALNFFRKHEKSLRPLMGGRQYELELNAFTAVLDGR